MFLGRIKSGQAYWWLKGIKIKEKSCPEILVLSINQYVVKRDIFAGIYKPKILLNCLFRTGMILKLSIKEAMK